MQSYGVPLISANTNNTLITNDVFETKAIAEYERDRKRAHKGSDTKKKIGIEHRRQNDTDNQSAKAPAWKRAGGEGKERRVLSRLGRNARDDREEEDSWADELAAAAEEEELLGKENRRSSHTPLVRLEDLVVRTSVKTSRKHSRHLAIRPTTTSTPLNNIGTDLLTPLMDTVNVLNNYNTTTSFSNFDDHDGYFEFSSPGADEWTVAVTEEGCLRYSTFGSTVGALSSSTTTSVIVMPCDW